MKVFIALLFIYSVTCDYVFLSGYAPTITASSLSNGNLATVTTSNGPGNPSFLAFHPTLSVLYAVDEQGTGTVSAYSIATNGALTFKNSLTSGGSTPAHVSVHPSGKWVYTPNYGDGTISVASVQSDGSLGTQIFKEYAGGNAHMAVTDPSGKYLFVVCKGSDYIVQYIVGSDGKLTRNNPATVGTQVGAGPRHIAFHPSKNFVYLINELGNSVTTFQFNPSAGTLTSLQTLSSLPTSWTGGGTGGEIQVSPDGNYVYASNRGHNSVGIWSIKSDGTLQSAGWEQGGGDINTPRHFSIDPSGNYMFVANQGSTSVTTFSINKSSGLLTKITTIRGLPNQPSFAMLWSSTPLTSTSTTSQQMTSSPTSSPLTSAPPTSSPPTSAPLTSAPQTSATSYPTSGPCANADANCAAFCEKKAVELCSCDPTTGALKTRCSDQEASTSGIISIAMGLLMCMLHLL